MPPAISRVWRHSRRCRSVRATGRGRERGGEGRPMPELLELTPESFEILVVRELRKIGLDVGELRVHRRATLPEPERGYLLELKGVVSRPPWQRRALVACRRPKTAVWRAGGETLEDNVNGAGAAVG